jgi:hypothetical protein
MNLAGIAGLAINFEKTANYSPMHTMKMVQLSGLSALMASALGQWDFELHL